MTYDTSSRAPASLRACAASTGKLLWSAELPTYSGPRRTPFLARGKAWSIDGAKTLHAFDLATGAPLLQVALPSLKLDHALVTGDDVVAFTRYAGNQPSMVGFLGIA